MKKFTKICLEIIAILLILGSILFIVGASLGAFSEFKKMMYDNQFTIPYIFEKDHTNRTDSDNQIANTESQKSSSSSDSLISSEKADDSEKSNNSVSTNDTKDFKTSDIKDLNINVSYGEIRIVKSNDNDKITVSAQNADSTYKVTQTDNTLSIIDSKNYNHKHINWDAFHDDHIIIQLSIPENMTFSNSNISLNAGLMEAKSFSADTLNLNVDAGQFSCDNLQVNEITSLTIGAGKLDVKKGTIKNLDLQCGTGQATIYATLDGKNSLNCSVGEINLITSGKESDFNYDISCAIGKVDINDRTYSGFSNSKHIDNGAAKSLNVTCNIGHIKVDFQ